MARRPQSAAAAPAGAEDWRPAFAALEKELALLVERIGERIELGIERALKNYTHRDDHSDLMAKVDELEKWRAKIDGERRVETKRADENRSNAQEWMRVLIPAIMPYVFIGLGFVYMMVKEFSG